MQDGAAFGVPGAARDSTHAWVLLSLTCTLQLPGTTSTCLFLIRDFYNPHRVDGVAWSWSSLPLLPLSKWEHVGCKATKILPAVVIIESTIVAVLWLSDKFMVSTGKLSQFAFR